MPAADGMPWVNLTKPATEMERPKITSRPPTDGLYQDSIVNRARSEAHPLYEDLLRFLEGLNLQTSKFPEHRIKEKLRKFWEVTAAADLAARVSGMVTPFAPQLNSDVPIAKRHDSIVRHMDILWPSASAAFGWLSEQFKQFPDRLAGMVERSQVEAALYGREVDQSFMDRLNSELSDSIQRGEGRDAWRERLKGIVDTKAGFDETIHRTATHRSYLEGQREILREPTIVDIFPYRQYLATGDNRVRPEHMAMNRKVYHKDSPLARQAAALLEEWNCRCSEVPMTEDDAVAIGISPGGEPVGSASLRELVPA